MVDIWLEIYLALQLLFQLCCRPKSYDRVNLHSSEQFNDIQVVLIRLAMLTTPFQKAALMNSRQRNTHRSSGLYVNLFQIPG